MNNLKGWLNQRGNLRPAIITACFLAIMLFIFSQFDRWYQRSILTEKQSEFEAILSPNGDNINNALHRRFSLISGLKAYIESFLATEGAFSSNEFELFGKGLYASISGIRRISVAPRGIITLEYPEHFPGSSIGFDLVKQIDPLTDDSIIQATQTKRIIVSDPHKLDKGGYTISALQAVFDKTGLWGFIIFEFDLVQILSESDINLASNGLSWGLFNETEQFIFGDESVAEKSPIEYRISLPQGNWYLFAAPSRGWEKAVEQDINIFYLINSVIIGLLTILIYVLTSQQSRLSTMVRVRTTELEKELNLRAIVEGNLKVNEEKFRSVFNQMSDIAILFQLTPGHHSGSIIEVNDAACRLLGFSHKELTGLSLPDLEVTEEQDMRIKKAVENSSPNQGFIEMDLLKRNGDTLPVEIRVNHFQVQAIEVGLMVARDITERKIAERNLQRANRALKVLIEFNESLVRAEEETELIEVLCNILVNTGEYDLAWAGFLDQNSQKMILRVEKKSEKALKLNFTEEYFPINLPIINDKSISLPLTKGDKVIGAIGIVLAKSSQFFDEEIFLLKKLADDISFGVQALRLREEARIQSIRVSESEALYHGLARNIPNGIVMLFDKTYRHILADGLGLSEFNLIPESVPGKTIEDIFPDNYHEELNSQYEAALAGKSITQEIFIHDKIYEMHCSPIRNDQNEIIMGLNLIQDITEHKKLQQEIIHLNEDLENRVALRTAELEEKNKELESFSYSVSHDLKAPLRGVSGYSQLLSESYSHLLDKEGNRFLQTIQDSALRMDQIINDMLAYSKMERRDIVKRQVNIVEMVTSILSEFKDEIYSRQIMVLQDFSFYSLFTDSEGLTQVLRNLIGNAIKFTRSQSDPKIEISGNEFEKFWQITVKDNGIGLDMAYKDKIFEIFQRLQNSNEFPGTGIGLAIVKKIMMRLQGSVDVESEEGKGATFTIHLMKQ